MSYRKRQGRQDSGARPRVTVQVPGADNDILEVVSQSGSEHNTSAHPSPRRGRLDFDAASATPVDSPAGSQSASIRRARDPDAPIMTDSSAAPEPLYSDDEQAMPAPTADPVGGFDTMMYATYARLHQKALKKKAPPQVRKKGATVPRSPRLATKALCAARKRADCGDGAEVVFEPPPAAAAAAAAEEKASTQAWMSQMAQWTRQDCVVRGKKKALPTAATGGAGATGRAAPAARAAKAERKRRALADHRQRTRARGVDPDVFVERGELLLFSSPQPRSRPASAASSRPASAGTQRSAPPSKFRQRFPCQCR